MAARSVMRVFGVRHSEMVSSIASIHSAGALHSRPQISVLPSLCFCMHMPLVTPLCNTNWFGIGQDGNTGHEWRTQIAALPAAPLGSR
jgi:hypothetical protein